MKRTATGDTSTFTQVPHYRRYLTVEWPHFNRRDKEDLDAGHLHRPGHQPAETHLLPHTSLSQVSSEQPLMARSKVKLSRLYNDSTVRYSTRINFDVACAMDFHKFPWDRQICKVKFESFSYSNNQISMRWLNRSMSQVMINYCRRGESEKWE